MGSAHFQGYVANLHRLHLRALMDELHRAHNAQRLRASLIVNPVTGLPYGETDQTARVQN